MAAKIALTCGDPAGIGPEIIEKVLAENPKIADKIAAIGPKNWLKNLPCEKVAVGNENFEISAGTPTEAGQKIALEAMTRAAAGTRNGEFSAVVTAPINKTNLKKIGFEFPGQTEFFAAAWNGVPAMAFAGGKLNVVLATWHIPLRKVFENLNFERLERSVSHANFLAQKMKNFGNEPAKIAVCGLNPHAGENGILGEEEREFIEPILQKLQKKFPRLSTKCVPADTAFRRQILGEFDALVSLFHDQALAAVKTLEFEESVNISLGLKFIRTSPDHGTAYEIAGKNLAQTKSIFNAIKVAAKLAGTPILENL